MEQENIGKRIGKLETSVAKVETTVIDHSRQLINQSEKNETLTKLATLVERQMEESKERERRQEIRDEKQNIQMEKFSDTLRLVNNNLTNLNSKQELIDNRVSSIEETLDSQKVDLVKVAKKVFLYLISAASGIALTYLYIKLGLKN